MHKSDDLNLAVATVFEELDKLNPGTLRCGIAIMDKQKPRSDIWITVKSEQGNTIQVSGDEPLDIHPLLHGAYNAWLKQEDFSYVLQDQDLLDYYDALTKIKFQSAISTTFSPEEKDQHQYYFNAVFQDGSLFAFMETEMTDEVKQLIKRFANVFNLTYKRFLDLQKAEAQAEKAKLDLIQIQTEKKRAEDALSELQITQKQLIQSEKMASLGELTAGIAHEIQNPLNFVNNFSEVNAELIEEMKSEIEKKNLDEVMAIAKDIKDNQEKITHHGKRADAIVKGMLQHSRTSSGVKEPTDINALADEYLRLAYHGLRAKDKSFNAVMKTDFDQSIGLINVIPQEIGRVILNLITNAFYAVSEKKKSLSITPYPLKGGIAYEPTITITTKALLPPLG